MLRNIQAWHDNILLSRKLQVAETVKPHGTSYLNFNTDLRLSGQALGFEFCPDEAFGLHEQPFASQLVLSHILLKD